MLSFYDLKDLILKEGEEYKTRQHIWHRYLSGITNGTCLEFGVWHGTSINYMANARPDATFYGFDSFEGLPEAWITGHPAGHFSVDLSKLKFVSNVQTRQGWFNKTLPTFVTEFEGQLQAIHIDCDLGSSTACVLRELTTLIKTHKPLILFDEFYNYTGFEDHEFKAFLEWVNLEKVDFRILGRNVKHQQVLIQVC